MRIEYTKWTSIRTIGEIPVGTVFTGTIGKLESNTGVFLKAFLCVISLENPSQTWSDLTLSVKDYQEYDATLTLEPRS